ncbi:nitroreductase family protein [Acetivibrio cellulolyticus]|uniref:nitroreductase family protein n=1 Tax=Acetivibrio cellulolyticus TaxID=35830 RepID=UPI0001E2FB60|nr:nitroreductase family protein [Acetivibrio cellulolyticus]
MNEVLKVIKSRRSVRKYKPEQIKQEELEMIIEAGIYAPSGHNSQPWRFTVIQDRKVIEHINDISKKVMATVEIEWIRNAGLNPDYDITYKAPTLIIVSGRRDEMSSQVDCCCAVENMLIAAESLNIGSVWLGFASFGFKIEGEAEKIGIPKGYEPYYVFVLGYKEEEYQPSVPSRNYNVVDYIR